MMKIFRPVKLLIICLIPQVSLAISEKEILGEGMHYLAKACTKKSDTDIFMATDLMIQFHSNLKISEVITASNHKINGKNPIQSARSSLCKSCDTYVFFLELLQREGIKIINEYGDITIQEVMQNDDLVKEIRKNIRNEMVDKVSTNILEENYR